MLSPHNHHTLKGSEMHTTNDRLLSLLLRQFANTAKVFFGDLGEVIFQGDTKSGISAMARMQPLDTASFQGEELNYVYGGTIRDEGPVVLKSLHALSLDDIARRVPFEHMGQELSVIRVRETLSSSLCLGQSVVDNSGHLSKLTAGQKDHRDNLRNPWVSEVLFEECAQTIFALVATDGHRMTSQFVSDALSEKQTWHDMPDLQGSLSDISAPHIAHFPAALLAGVGGTVISFSLGAEGGIITTLTPKGWVVEVSWESVTEAPPPWIRVIPCVNHGWRDVSIPLAGKPPKNTKGREYITALLHHTPHDGSLSMAFLTADHRLLTTIESEESPLPDGDWRLPVTLSMTTKYMHTLMDLVNIYADAGYDFMVYLPAIDGSEEGVRPAPMRVDFYKDPCAVPHTGGELAAIHLIMPRREKKLQYVANYYFDSENSEEDK